MAISNNSTGLRPGVCTSTTRPTAPYEGQMIYETDTDLTYIWGGSAWQQVSGGTAVGNSGLVYIKSQTVGTAVSSVTVSSAFSTTYDNYKIIYTGGTSSVANLLRFQLDGLTTGYYSASYGATYGGGAFISNNSSGGGTWPFVGYANGSVICVLSMEIFSPFLTQETFYTAAPIANSAFTGYVSSGGENIDTASRTGFILSTTTGTLTGGTITVYGYRKA